MKNKILLITLTLSFISVNSAWADSDSTTTTKHPKKITQPGNDTPAEWTGNISAGGTSNSGNSTSYNANAGFALNYNKKRWVNSITASAQIGGDKSSGLSSRNYSVQGQSKYFFAPPTCYIYALANYTLDSFNTYKTVITGSSGYGKRVINRQDMTLDLQIGPSYTRRQIAGSGVSESEVGVFTQASYVWNVSSDIQFSQNLSVTKDRKNTGIDALSSITSNVIQNIGLKVSFEYKHNTRIPPESDDTKKTDTITTFSVVYSF